MGLFQEIVVATGGVYKPFAQIDYIDEQKLPERFRNGVCCALSTIYVSRYSKASMAADDPFQGKTFQQLAKDKKSSFFVQQIQQMENSRSYTYSAVGKELNGMATEEKQAKSLETLFDGVGLARLFQQNLQALGQKSAHLISKQEGEGEDAPFMQIIGCMTTFDGRYLLKFPSHYVSAITDNGRKKYKFFDPNFGQGVFRDVASYKKFLFTFLNDTNVRASYKLGPVYLCGVSL